MVVILIYVTMVTIIFINMVILVIIVVIIFVVIAYDFIYRVFYIIRKNVQCNMF